ncbi:MAG: DUF5610 domain-containing protein [Candidatus Hydrogenedentes bacterium]|nr:DUF5610 domain-containing protein [Candidatus Hydrogenedentota bacterium]
MIQTVQTPPVELAAGRAYPQSARQATYQSFSFQFEARIDVVTFGTNAVSNTEAQEIVLNRAFEKLRAVVAEAREALGIPEGEAVDTSPEATANRIADFALNFFSAYARNNGLDDNEEGRARFADFIGGAIAKGIEEARGILNALAALNPETESSIDQIASLVRARLDAFIANGLGGE